MSLGDRLWPSTSSTVRPTLFDRMQTGTRIAVVSGPLTLPEPDVVRRRLADFAALGPATRIATFPGTNGDRRWRYDPDAMHDAVVVADGPEHPLELLRRSAAPEPFRVTLAGDYLLTEHDHGIGEIQLAMYAKLVATGQLESTADLYRTISSRDDGLITAVGRVFGSDPRRVRTVLRILEGLPDPIPGDGAAVSPAAAATTSTLAPTTVDAVRLDAGAVAEVRAWRDADGVDASVKTLMLCGIVRAFDEQGLTLHPDIAMPVDLRRYLRPGVNPLGNFVAGLYFRHRAGDDPAALQRAMAETIASGRPVASGVRSSAAAAAMRLRARPLEGGNTAVPGAGAAPPRLLFSGINEMAPLRTLGWRDPATAALFGRVDPMGPNDITIGMVGVHGSVTLSVSFHPDRHDRNVISAALRCFGDAPTSYLR